MKNISIALGIFAFCSLSFAASSGGISKTQIPWNSSSDSVPARLYKAMEALQKADKTMVTELGDGSLAIVNKRGFGMDCTAATIGAAAVESYSCTLNSELAP